MKARPRTLLVVDDDATLRRALASVLTPMGYHVLGTGDPDMAYALLAREPVDAVLLDVRLPTMSGLALYLAIAHRWPTLQGRIAIMTGDTEAADVREWAKLNRCPLFPKPFRIELLADWLEAAWQPRRRRLREG